MQKTIPLSVPNISGNEWQYIKDCLDTNWVSSVGSYVDKFEKDFAYFTGAKHAISTVNGTAALHIALLLADVKPKDLVIVPNLTFIASVNAIKYCGAEPLLVDIKSDTWLMDIDLLDDFLSKNTYFIKDELYLNGSNERIRAIMPVHILGNICDMIGIEKLAKKYNFIIIEDSTEALGSYYQNKHAGNFGKIGCFSFNGNKIMTTGGGGMIVTDDDEIAKKAKHITTQAKSDPFEYIHDEIGYNYRLVNILAAMGVAQLEQMPNFLKRKMEVNTFYRKKLENIDGISFQYIAEGIQSNYWLFTILHNDKQAVIKKLTNNQIQARPFWKPMNQLEMFQNSLYVSKEDVASEIYKKGISLPCSTNISNEEMLRVVNSIKDCS